MLETIACSQNPLHKYMQTVIAKTHADSDCADVLELNISDPTQISKTKCLPSSACHKINENHNFNKKPTTPSPTGQTRKQRDFQKKEGIATVDVSEIKNLNPGTIRELSGNYPGMLPPSVQKPWVFTLLHKQGREQSGNFRELPGMMFCSTKTSFERWAAISRRNAHEVGADLFFFKTTPGGCNITMLRPRSHQLNRTSRKLGLQ